eukprot:2347141-Heterocapsa_arctica.AAC.1
MGSAIVEKENMGSRHGKRPYSDMDSEEDRDMESVHNGGMMSVYEDPTWNVQVIVHADEIGHGNCCPTDLIECKSGQGWWR